MPKVNLATCNKVALYFLGFIFYLPLFAQNLTITSPNGNEFWQVGKTPSITWDSNGLTANVVLEYSTNNGSSWTNITTVPNTTNSYEWTIPNSVSTQCLVRAKSNTTVDESDATFKISDDTSSCTIVVLGSSTALGNGADPIENSWVNLYASAIFQKNTKLDVVNLAKEGYTTYQILPTGTAIPDGVNETIDLDRNITKAIIDYSPVAIIINMPSNDTAEGYSVTTQMENYDILNTYATNNSVPLWIATPQPRNFSSNAKIQMQIDVKEDILLTYGKKAIDFWDGIANIDGTILNNLDDGGGIHVNNEGHAILFNRVLDKNIDALTCIDGSLSVSEIITNGFETLKVYPNPAQDYVIIDFNSEFSGELKIELFDVLGRSLLEKRSDFVVGSNTIRTTIKDYENLKSQFIFGKLTFKTNGGSVQKSIKLMLQ